MLYCQFGISPLYYSDSGGLCLTGIIERQNVHENQLECQKPSWLTRLSCKPGRGGGGGGSGSIQAECGVTGCFHGPPSNPSVVSSTFCKHLNDLERYWITSVFTVGKTCVS